MPLEKKKVFHICSFYKGIYQFEQKLDGRKWATPGSVAEGTENQQRF